MASRCWELEEGAVTLGSEDSCDSRMQDRVWVVERDQSTLLFAASFFS